VPILSTLSKAFAHFDGARATNPRWGWAAQSDDGKVVVLTMWRDQIKQDGSAIVYGPGPSADVPLWTNRLGNRDRIKKLQHAQSHCGGLFRAVIVDAVDAKSGTRSTRKKYYADDQLVMKLETLNPDTGEFIARSVEAADA